MVPYISSIANFKSDEKSEIRGYSRQRPAISWQARLDQPRPPPPTKRITSASATRDGASMWVPTAAIFLLQYKHIPTTFRPQAAVPVVSELRHL